MDPQPGASGADGAWTRPVPPEELDREELLARVEALEGRARAAERELKRARDSEHEVDGPDRVASILEDVAHFGDLFYTVDRDWLLTYVNAPAAARWGRSRDELVGRYLWEVFPEATSTRSYHMHRFALAEGRIVRFETWSTVLERWVDVAIYPQRDGLAVWVRDIDDRRRAEEELRTLNERLEARVAQRTEALREAKEEAERASAVKGQFLSTMSHELRTPLNAVIGLADLMETEVIGPLNGRQQFHLTRIRACAWHLVAIIDEILTYARTESGQEQVRLTQVDLGEIARQVVAILENQATVQGLTLDLEGADEPVSVVADGRKIRQILINLVGNAVKYTREGGVLLRLDAGPEQITLRVSDTGPGIASEWHERIFEPFVQVDQSSTRAFGGTGLGLAITRRLARLLGGEVDVESEPGVGSTFTCRLPHGAATS
jgi:PAS domain S-box-containing protein